MKLVDVHCHLYDSRFNEDLDEVIERFREVGGKFIICSGTCPDDNRKVLELARRFDVVKVSFGLYPVGNFSEDIDGELAWIEEHAADCVAIGECGLDFNDEVLYGHDSGEPEGRADFDKQKVLFERQIDLAKKLGRPIVVHSRKAEAEVIEILEARGCDKVVMHCFSGKKGLIKRCVENGWSFSVPSVIARLEHFKMLVELVPLGQLLTETDAPYLSAVVGTRSEPVNILVTLEEIARIKRLGVSEVAVEIFNNATRLFKL